MTHPSPPSDIDKQVAAVTGATGFVGQRLVQHLVDAGFQVRVLTRSSHAAQKLPSETQVFVADLTDPCAPLDEFLTGVDILYHCAGELRDESSMQTLHVEATRRLAKAAQQHIRHWVQLSSIGVYGRSNEGVIDESTPPDPVGRYEQTKAESDEIVAVLSESGGYTLSVLRPANIFGSGMSGCSLRQLLKAIQRGIFFFIGKPGATSNYIHVDNVVEALLLCGNSPAAQGRVYNLSDTRTLEDFVDKAAVLLGCRRPKLRIPEGYVRLVSNVLGKLPGFPLSTERVDVLVTRVEYPCDRVIKELGYIHKIPMETGLQEFLEKEEWAERQLHQDVPGREKQLNTDDWAGLPWEKAERPVSTAKMLWILFFCYSTFVAIVFQKLLLPLVPSLHSGHGLLSTDAQYFHNVALSLAEEIRGFGWSRWTPWPTYASGINVALLAALYVFFDPDPALLIPVHAAVHATGGLLIFMIGRALWPGRVGTYGGLITATLFIVFPSALNWYGQPHKDGYAIAGLLLVLFSWLRWADTSFGWRNILLFMLGNFIGSMLVASVRLYGLQLLSVVTLAAYVVVILALSASGSWSIRRVVTGLVGVLSLLLITMAVKDHTHLDEQQARHTHAMQQYSQPKGQVQGYAGCPHGTTWSWQSSSWVPTYFSKYAEQVSTLRASFACSGYHAGSTLDRDDVPGNITEMLSYLPRGLQVALWAPFPDTWFSNFSLTRMVGWAETIIWYLLMPGIMLTLYFRRTPAVLFSLVFALGFLVIYGYVIPNIGTLHRVRYPFLFILMLLGALGWVRLLTGFKKEKHQPGSGKAEGKIDLLMHPQIDSAPVDLFGLSRKSATSAGLLVSVLTAGTYLMLLLRDVLMGRWFGLSSELDAFYMAMVLPMFLVNVISIPFGAALIPLYQEAKIRSSQQEAQLLISHLSFLISALLGGVSLLMLLFSPWLIGIVGWGFGDEQLAYAQHVLPFGAVILLLSGSVVLCNSVLNVHHRFLIPALAQVVVPVLAIMCLFLFGDIWSVGAVAAGMLAGQTLNLLLILSILRKEGISLWPQWPAIDGVWRSGISLFMALAAAALFVNAATVIDNAMASTLKLGSVGIYSLGSKVVLFVTGIIGAGIVTVMLPHFSSFFASNRVSEGQRELTFYLFLGTVVSIPLGLGFFLLAEDLVRLLFLGGALDEAAVNIVGDVAAFGMIQLPFFSSYMLLLKFANASKRSGMVLAASAFGLGLNVILNVFLMELIGVAGLALATSLSMLVTSSILLMLIHRAGHIAVVDILQLLLLWSLYLAVVLCIQFKSYAGVFIAIGALLLMAVEQWKSVRFSAQSGLSAGDRGAL